MDGGEWGLARKAKVCRGRERKFAKPQTAKSPHWAGFLQAMKLLLHAQFFQFLIA